MQSHNIGALFKELRVERGLRIADVAGELSVSTVSKFENGLSDISVEKLCLLLSNLGMDAPEFLKFSIKIRMPMQVLLIPVWTF